MEFGTDIENRILFHLFHIIKKLCMAELYANAKIFLFTVQEKLWIINETAEERFRCNTLHHPQKYFCSSHRK